MAWYLGIDIGSATSKGVLAEDARLAEFHVLPSGMDYRAAALKLKDELLARAGLSWNEIACTVATGYGAGSVSFSNQQATDIRCCGRGIHSIFPSVRTVIDVQSQSSQALRLNEKGQVTNFIVSEKCAAGSGVFLEVIANVLQVALKDVGPLSLKSKNPVAFTTGCAVFGESEVISRVAEGATVEDILAGVHEALANKIDALVHRVGLEKDCALSGGGALDIGLVKSVAKKLGIELLVPPNPRIVTALGAAILAREMSGLAESGETAK